MGNKTLIEKNFWQDRCVFLTGATGFLGSWMVTKLKKLKAKVVGLVRDISETKKNEFFPDAVLDATVFGSLEDYDTLLRAVNEYEIDTVFHLGAQTIVGTANRNPRSTFESNIRGSWNLLEACRQISTVKRIVVASSDKAYGEQPQLPYDEDMPLQGSHPYDVSKSCMDLIAQTYHNTYNTPVCITRCGNIYGGGDLNLNRIIPGTIRSVIREEAPIIRSDGTCVRDYVYVLDIVDAYLLLAENIDRAGVRGKAFNFSNKEPVSVIDLVKTIVRLMNREDLSPVVLNEASHEIKYQYLSSEKARTLLGWRPSYLIEKGLIETIGWYKAYFERVAGH